MDLLGGYDSDDASSSSSTSNQNVPVTIKSQPKPMVKVQPPPQATKRTMKKGKKKGSRILSLAAVLPQHILDQLTKATSGAGNYDDSDEDEDDFRAQPPKAAASTTTTTSSSKQKQKQNFGKDPELTSFLAELQATKRTASSKSSNQTQDNTGITSSEPPKTVLGAAFVTSSVETIVRKINQPNVRDIHQGAGTLSSSKSVPMTTTDESITNRKKPPPPPPPVSVETVMEPTNEDSDNDEKDSEEEADLPPPPAPEPARPRTMMMPRAVRAAPSLAPHVVRAAPSTSYATSSVARPGPSYPQPPAAIAQQQQQQQPQQFQSKKARRRHMEQLLRAGNTSEITGDIHLEGHAPDQYAPEEQTYQAPTSHGVRVVPVSMYESAGTTTTGADISGKQKSKHQLNALMANAASLEQQRARAPYSASSSSGTSHRANAKRKYGW